MSAYHQWFSGYGTMQASAAASSYDSAPPAKRARTAATSPQAAPPVNYNAKLVIMPPNSYVSLPLPNPPRVIFSFSSPPPARLRSLASLLQTEKHTMTVLPIRRRHHF
jgi:hypothetical protein